MNPPNMFQFSNQFKLMLFDLIGEIHSLSLDQNAMADYLSSRIRELSGSKVVIITLSIKSQKNTEEEKYYFNPKRKEVINHTPLFSEIVNHLKTLQDYVLIDSNNNSDMVTDLEKLGYDSLLYIPMKLSDKTLVGTITLLGLPDSHVDYRIQDAMKMLASYMAIVFKNATLYKFIEGISEQRANKLKKTEQRFTELYNQSPDILLTINKEGYIIDVNNQCTIFTEYSKEGIIGMTLAEFDKVFSTDLEPIFQDPHQFFPMEMEQEMVSISDTVRVFNVSVNRVSIENDSIYFFQMRDITQQKQAQETIFKQQYYLSQAQKIARIGTWEVNITNNEITWTDETYHIFDLEPGTKVSLNLFLQLVHPEDRPAIKKIWRDAIKGKRNVYDIEHRILIKDQVKWIREIADITRNTQKRVEKVIGVAQDITQYKEKEAERLHLEEQLRQTQKMEAIGVLAGGIAHDFNNILGILQGYNELNLLTVDPSSDMFEHMIEMKKAMNRATSLTQQLLAYSRKQMIQPEFIHLNEQIKDLWNMLTRLVGEDISLIEHLTDRDLFIEVDKGQLQQIMVNLVINSVHELRSISDQLEKTITISTGIYHSHNEICSICNDPIVEQDYAIISIKDNGRGIPEDILPKIFDPFFTTKGIGKGTGMGLSTIQGIVKQNEGHIVVKNNPGSGVEFQVIWPLPEKTQSPQSLSNIHEDTKISGKGTILIVEDEPQLLALSEKLLSRHGFTIITAENGEKGKEIIESTELSIDLLLTDVILPGLDGIQCAEIFKKVFPKGMVLYTSGYLDDRLSEKGLRVGDANILYKPYNIKKLIDKVQTLFATYYS